MRRLVLAFFSILAAAGAQSPPAFRWILELDGSGLDKFAGLGTDAQGNVYVAGSTRSPDFPVKNAAQNHLATAGSYDVFVTKLDPSGNIVYSTYFGGSADDLAAAMTVDSVGNVYVTGTTASPDFPITAGSYSPTPPAPPPPGPTFGATGGSFLFKVNPDGSVAYSTYFTSLSAQTQPNAIAVDSGGSVYLTGLTYAGLPVTPGAYQTTCACVPIDASFLVIGVTDGFLARFDPTGSTLLFATFFGVTNGSGNALAVAGDGSAYVGSPTGVYRFDSAGASLLASSRPWVNAQAIALAPAGGVYLAGVAGSGTNQFQPTAGAFQTDAGTQPVLPGQGLPVPVGILLMDPQLDQTLAATYYSGRYSELPKTLAVDGAGNVYLGGYSAIRGLPTRTPLVEGFGTSLGTGFVAELSGDLSALLFASDFGNNVYFGVTGLAAAAGGGFVLGGATDTGDVWINSVQTAAPPPLRIDAVENAASLMNDAISPGETILVRGAGFAPGAQLLVSGTTVAPISVTANAIAAALPATLPDGPVVFQVAAAGGLSNAVVVAGAANSPGLFSTDGSGVGQGYILNQDGTLNSPANPAAPGDQVTIFATGAGPVSISDGYAVAEYLPAVYIDGFYCDGVAAAIAPVAGLPGDVYQLTVYVPNPGSMAANNPNLVNFTFPPQVGVVLNMNGAASQDGLSISIGQ